MLFALDKPKHDNFNYKFSFLLFYRKIINLTKNIQFKSKTLVIWKTHIQYFVKKIISIEKKKINIIVQLIKNVNWFNIWNQMLIYS